MKSMRNWNQEPNPEEMVDVIILTPTFRKMRRVDLINGLPYTEKYQDHCCEEPTGRVSLAYISRGFKWGDKAVFIKSEAIERAFREQIRGDL